MARRALDEEHIRKLQRTGENADSYAVTLPKELIKQLGWQKRQKVVVSKVGKTLVIRDWE